MPHQSSAAILIVSDDLQETARGLEQVMRHERYRAQNNPTPRGYPLAQDEQISFELGRARGMVVVRVPVDAVFRVARWWSRHDPETPLAAVRRYAHSQPCLKFFSGGLPIWRMGDDPDYEVDYDVPTRRPVDAFEPAGVGLPTSVHDAADLMVSVPPEVKSAWLRSNSRLL